MLPVPTELRLQMFTCDRLQGARLSTTACVKRYRIANEIEQGDPMILVSPCKACTSGRRRACRSTIPVPAFKKSEEQGFLGTKRIACRGCGRGFLPLSKRHQYCTTKCRPSPRAEPGSWRRNLAQIKTKQRLLDREEGARLIGMSRWVFQNAVARGNVVPDVIGPRHTQLFRKATVRAFNREWKRRKRCSARWYEAVPAAAAS